VGGSISFSASGRLAEIREARRYPDGRYDLLVVGTEALRDHGRHDGPPALSRRRGDGLDDEVGDETRRAGCEHGDTPLRPLLELLQPREARRPTRSTSGSSRDRELHARRRRPGRRRRRATGMDFGLSAEVDPESMAETRRR